MVTKSVLRGLAGTVGLLAFYFSVITFISGGDFALGQFFSFWYFIISLASGFGIQIGLYTYLKNISHQRNSSGKIVAVSGTTSTVAMISCCSHYLVNVLPIIGITGAITLVAQYQVELFWLGILANLLGIAYMIRKISLIKKII